MFKIYNQLFKITNRNILIILLITVCFFNVQILFSQDTVANRAFKVGEYLKYRVYYSSTLINATAGEAILTVRNWEEKKHGKKKAYYRITGQGRSKGMFNWFYKVRDRFESFVDTSTLLPYAFVRRTREGKYTQNDLVIFDRTDNEATVNSTEKFKVPSNVHDFVSAFYYMRTLNIDDFDTDSLFYINFFLDDSVYLSAVKYMGKANVVTQWGTILCLKIAPMMASGEIFADSYPMYIYVSDDNNHLPILAESKIIVGSVKMELIEYDGLVSPLKIRIKKGE